MLKAKDLRVQTPSELQDLLKENQQKLFDLINQFHMDKKIDQPHLMRSLRKDIARILTILREKELETLSA